MLKDRAEAAKKLAEKVNKFLFRNCIVLAIPNGGVIIGRIIAQQLEVPLELIIAEEMGHPDNYDFKIGTVCLQSRTLKRRVYVSRDYIDQETSRIRNILLNHYQSITGKPAPLALQNKDIVLVSDNADDLEQLRKSIELVRLCKPSSITLVVPVIPAAELHSLEKEVDDVIYLKSPQGNQTTAVYFENFERVSEEELTQLLQA